VKPGAPFFAVSAAVPSAAGFAFAGLGVAVSPGGAAVTVPAGDAAGQESGASVLQDLPGRGGAWVVGCFAAGICWR